MTSKRDIHRISNMSFFLFFISWGPLVMNAYDVHFDIMNVTQHFVRHICMHMYTWSCLFYFFLYLIQFIIY